MTRCPSSDELQRLLADRLGGPEASAVEAHVQTCAGCQRVLDQLTRGPDAIGGGPASRGQSVGDVLRRLEQRPPGPGEAAALAPHSPTPPAALGTTRDYQSAPTIPPGQAEPPPRRLGGPLPQLASEIHALLHQRLRLLCLLFVVGWGLVWTHKFFRFQMTPDIFWLIMVPGGALLAFEMVMAVIFWAPRSRSLWSLRCYELLAYAAAITFLL